jgi:hypothetical protein
MAVAQPTKPFQTRFFPESCPGDDIKSPTSDWPRLRPLLLERGQSTRDRVLPPRNCGALLNARLDIFDRTSLRLRLTSCVDTGYVATTRQQKAESSKKNNRLQRRSKPSRLQLRWRALRSVLRIVDREQRGLYRSADPVLATGLHGFTFFFFPNSIRRESQVMPSHITSTV